MVCLCLSLPMVMDLVRGYGRKVFRFALLASFSNLFPSFFSRERVPSFALVLVRGV